MAAPQIFQRVASARAIDDLNRGNSYERGIDVVQDWKKAVFFYRRAAHEGLDIAQNNLSVCYENGDGVPQDWTMAARYYRMATRQRAA